jgi:hypothetical protein
LISTKVIPAHYLWYSKDETKKYSRYEEAPAIRKHAPIVD